MRRRDFISGLAGGAALSLFGDGAAHANTPSLAINDDGWGLAFKNASDRHPWLLGWNGLGEEEAQQGFGGETLRQFGKVPRDLEGTLYRNGPALHARAGFRGHHWLDGDGMVHAWDFSRKDGVRHFGRMVETDKFQAESKAGRRLVQTLGTARPGLRQAKDKNEANVGNMNIIRHGDELLALWSGGAAWRLNRKTLKTQGMKVWSEDSRDEPFGALPKVDDRGDLWNIGYDYEGGKLVIWHIDSTGKLVRRGSVSDPQARWLHDFGMTERWLVLVLPPLMYAHAARANFWERLEWRAEEATRIWLVDRDTLEVAHRFEVPSFWSFAFGNAWEENDGTVRFELLRRRSPALVQDTMRLIMRGEIHHSDHAEYSVFELNPKNGEVGEHVLSGIPSLGFPRFDERMRGRGGGSLYAMSADPTSNGGHRYSQLVRLNPEKGLVDSFSFPGLHFGEEHVFAWKPGTSVEDGWLVGTAFEYNYNRTWIRAFDAHHLSDGPVMEAVADYQVPLGLYGNFVPKG